MNRVQEKWFHRGKEARANNRPREVSDARLSLASREQFFAGWDAQDRMMMPPRTDAQAAESSAVIGRLKQWAKESL